MQRLGRFVFIRVHSWFPILGLTLSLLASGCATHQDTPPCCAANISSSIPLTDKSLYQLDSAWTNDAGQALKLGQLRGRVQVVAMFFASCTYACPIIVQDMRRIEQALPKDMRSKVGFTLVTIDTERDTPAALHAYRMAHHLPGDGWTLLHGSPDDTLELAALLGVKFKREATGQFAHSNLITILNEQGEIIHQVVGLNQDIHDAVKRITSAVGASANAHAAHE